MRSDCKIPETGAGLDRPVEVDRPFRAAFLLGVLTLAFFEALQWRVGGWILAGFATLCLISGAYQRRRRG